MTPLLQSPFHLFQVHWPLPWRIWSDICPLWASERRKNIENDKYTRWALTASLCPSDSLNLEGPSYPCSSKPHSLNGSLHLSFSHLALFAVYVACSSLSCYRAAPESAIIPQISDAQQTSWSKSHNLGPDYGIICVSQPQSYHITLFYLLHSTNCIYWIFSYSYLFH